MTGFKNWAIILVASILLAGGIGCAALSTLITPANIDKKAVTYAASAGVIDANDFRGYPNLDKAVRLKAAVDAAFKVKELSLTQMMEKNTLDYAQLSDVAETNMKIAQAKEEQIFGEKGLLSMGLSLAGFGTLTGVVGLMRKRPGDLTPAEVEKAVQQVTYDKTTRERQMGELVKGAQAFIDGTKNMTVDQIVALCKNPDGTVKDPGTVLKDFMAKAQSADTKQTVATIKAAA